MFNIRNRAAMRVAAFRRMTDHGDYAFLPDHKPEL
jgi:hypothetical protein